MTPRSRGHACAAAAPGAARPGVAGAAVEVVETGLTLRENGFHPVEDWLQVPPNLIANRAAFFAGGDEIRAKRRALGGRS